MEISGVIKRVNTILLLFIVGYGLFWLFTGVYYCHPNAEDFSLTSISKSEGIIPGAVHLLVTYDGRYFTNILHGINPMALGYLGGYKATIGFNILFFTFCIYYLLQTLNNGRQKLNTLLISTLFVVVHFALTPSLVHELYWMVSSFVYLYCWCFTLLWVSTLIRFNKTESKLKKNIYFLLTAIFLVCSIGINEMMLITNAFLLLTLGMYQFFYLKREKYAYTLLSVLGLSSYAFFLSCPGISQRFSSFDNEHHGTHYDEIIGKSISHFGTELADWFSYSGFLLFFILVISLSFGGVLKFDSKLPKLNLKVQLLLYLLGFMTVYIMTSAFYVPMGHEEFIPHRIYTSIWTGVHIWILLLLPLILSIPVFKNLMNSSKKEYLLTISLLLLGYTLSTEAHNIQLLKEDYNSGRLSGFDAQMKMRYNILEKYAQEEHCESTAELLPLTNTPKSVYNPPDIFPNREASYWNEAYESYFEVAEIRMFGDTITKKHLIKDLLYE